MGIVLYGGGVALIKGRVGGQVFQVCGQTKSIRTHLMHRPSRSKVGYSARHHLSVLASAWQSLTPTQQGTFVTAAQTWPANNRYGISIVLTGYQLFFLLNKRMALGNFSLFTSCQAYSVATAPNVSFAPIDYVGHTLYLTVTGSWPANVYLFTYVTNPYSLQSVNGFSKQTFMHCFSAVAPGSYNCWSYLTPAQQIVVNPNFEVDINGYAINIANNGVQDLGTL
jgi:hypothetical protein